MGEQHIGVENGSGINRTDDKLANGGGAAVCRVARMCYGLWPWTLYNVVDISGTGCRLDLPKLFRGN